MEEKKEVELEQENILNTEETGSTDGVGEEEAPLTPSEREELEQLREEKARSIKEKLYDKVTVSVKTMDRIIAALVVLFLIVVIMGIFVGK